MSQLVDPFSPTQPTKMRSPLSSPYGSKWIQKPEPFFIDLRTKRKQSAPGSSINANIEGVVPRSRVTTTVKPPSQPRRQQTQALNELPRVTTVRRSHPVRSGIITAVRIPLLIVLTVVFSFLMQSIILGSITIGIYAIYAIVKRVSSKTSFQLAVVSLIGIIALSGIGTNAQLVSNFTIYTYLLIIIGTVSLTWDSN